MKITQKVIVLFVSIYSAVAFADTTIVYFNGDILTMQGDRPQYVEALVVENDKIIFAGNKD
jgi:hypothetical protein